VLCGDGITKELPELSLVRRERFKSIACYRETRIDLPRFDPCGSRRHLSSLGLPPPPVLINAYPPTPRRHFITVHANLARSKCQLRERVRRAVLFSPSHPSAVSLGFFYFRVPRIDRRRRRVLKKRANMEGTERLRRSIERRARGTRANSPHCGA